MKVIGISGKKYSGKDTLYTQLKVVSSVPIYRFALADLLKEEVYEAVLKPHGMSRELLDNEKKEIFRPLMKWWGTEFKRGMFRDDYWIDALTKKIKKELPEGSIAVITDIRYPNEVEMIKNRFGGLVVRISRPSIPTDDTHISETALDDYEFDYRVENVGAIEALQEPALGILNLL